MGSLNEHFKGMDAKLSEHDEQFKSLDVKLSEQDVKLSELTRMVKELVDKTKGADNKGKYSAGLQLIKVREIQFPLSGPRN